MASTRRFNDYPKIEKIDSEGNILGLDKNGAVNTQFNTRNINEERFRAVFGEPYQYLYDKYKNERLSRFEKNARSYEDDRYYNSRPDDYYTDRDKEYDRQQKEELDKNKRAKKWLAIILGIVVLCFIVFLVFNHFSKQNAENENQANNNDQLQQENQQLKQDMKDTQQKLEDTETDGQKTQQEINSLQSRIDNLKNNEQAPTNDSAIQSYQDGINKLQEAQNSKVQGNYDDVKEKIQGLDKTIDKEKLTEEGRNAWQQLKQSISDLFQ